MADSAQVPRVRAKYTTDFAAQVPGVQRNHFSCTCDIFQGDDKEQGESKSIGDQNDEDERPEVINDDGANSDFMPSSKEMTVSQRF